MGITRLKTKGESVLTNSGSNPPPGMLKTEGADKPKEEHTHREPHIRKLTDLIYIGNAEVAHSEQIICRQGICSVVELSNIDQNDISFSRKSTPFCSSAAVLRLQVCKFDLLEIKSHFQEINTFVKGAIERNKKVLIVYPSDTGLSAVLALQYLMHHQGMNLAKVYNLLAREYPELQLSSAYHGLLKDLNHQLYPCDQDLLPPLSGGSSSTNAKTFLP